MGDLRGSPRLPPVFNPFALSGRRRAVPRSGLAPPSGRTDPAVDGPEPGRGAHSGGHNCARGRPPAACSMSSGTARQFRGQGLLLPPLCRLPGAKFLRPGDRPRTPGIGAAARRPPWDFVGRYGGTIPSADAPSGGGALLLSRPRPRAARDMASATGRRAAEKLLVGPGMRSVLPRATAPVGVFFISARKIVGCDHTSTNAPDPIRTPQLSVLGRE